MIINSKMIITYYSNKIQKLLSKAGKMFQAKQQCKSYPIQNSAE